MTRMAQFENGETVVFGPEGFARIEAIGERKLLGRQMTVVDLFVLDSKMNVTVPLDRAFERGLRPVTSAALAKASLLTLATRTGEPIPWNRDGRLLKDRFAEGEIGGMVDVIASLIDTQETRKLNDGQRTLLDRARKAYLREVGAALGLDEDATNARIDVAITTRIGVV